MRITFDGVLGIWLALCISTVSVYRYRSIRALVSLSCQLIAQFRSTQSEGESMSIPYANAKSVTPNPFNANAFRIER